MSKMLRGVKWIKNAAVAVAVGMLAAVAMLAGVGPAAAATCVTERSDAVTFNLVDSWGPGSHVAMKIKQTWHVCWGPAGHFAYANQKVEMSMTSWGISTGVTPGSNPAPTTYYATQDDNRKYWFGSVRICYPVKSPICGPAMSMGGYTRSLSPYAAGSWLKTFDIHATDTSGGWSWYPNYHLVATN